jgi:peptide/nickel transport system substrate-binding protein
MRKIALVLLVLLLSVSFMALAEGQKEESKEEPKAEEPQAAPAAGGEAPQIAEMVKAGKLPPLEDRLPKDPVVLNPVEKVGQYGGTWDQAVGSPGMGEWLMYVMVEPLVRWKPDLTGYMPGLAKAWEYSDDGMHYTIYLREGVKWSDGAPFTADDIMFWWEDLILDEEYEENPPRWSRMGGGELMTVDKIDDYTVRFNFPEPDFIFHAAIAQGFWECRGYLTPSHFLKQFHPRYNPDGGDYQKLREVRTDQHLNPDYPGLWAWQTESWDASKGILIMERNPYYWKIDSAGNQLPYIDRVQCTVTESKLLPLKAIAGEIDCKARGFRMTDIPLLLENQEKGDYRVIMWQTGDGGAPMLFLNWDVVDENLRPVFRNQKFRIALSLAMNRDRIRQIVYNGFGDLQNATMSEYLMHYNAPGGRQLDQEWAQAYADYDPEKAKELLNEAGIVDQDGDGMRDLPDGSPMLLLFDVDVNGLESIDACQLMAEDWQAVGVNTQVNAISGANITARSRNAELHFQVFGYGSDVDLLTYPDNVFPVGNSRFHPLIGRWQQTGGDEGEEPTGWMRELLDLYYEAIATKDTTARNQLVLDAIRLHVEHGPVIYAPLRGLPVAVVVKNNFRNVPEFGVAPNGTTYAPITGPWAPGFPGTTEPSQYFIEQ